MCTRMPAALLARTSLRCSCPLDLRLYGYNGTSVRTVWKRDGLFGGAIQVSPTSVSLEYDKEYHGPSVHEVLHVTANGLE
jgi:hypothetical protein